MRYSLYLGRAGGQSWMGDGAWVRHLLDHIEQRCCDRMSRAFALREYLRHAAVLQCTAPCKQIVPRTMSRGRGHGVAMDGSAGLPTLRSPKRTCPKHLPSQAVRFLRTGETHHVQHVLPPLHSHVSDRDFRRSLRDESKLHKRDHTPQADARGPNPSQPGYGVRPCEVAGIIHLGRRIGVLPRC